MAEHLGLLLLKGIAAVADVARPEDVGLDAISTLLRRDSDGNCYAEDSFVVQLKSSSTETIEFRDHELKWFITQSQPMFLGRIFLSEAKISLYTTLHIRQAVMALHATSVETRFGESQVPPMIDGHRFSPWIGAGDHRAIVWLGKPVLEWSIQDIVDPNWANATYNTLKRFLAIARSEFDLISLGQCSVLNWETNECQSITTQWGFMKGHPADLNELAHRSAPCLHALMLWASSARNTRCASLAHAMLDTAKSLRELGCEIDPDNLFDKFAGIGNPIPLSAIEKKET